MKYIKYVGYGIASCILSFLFLLIVGFIVGILAKGFSMGYNLW